MSCGECSAKSEIIFINAVGLGNCMGEGQLFNKIISVWYYVLYCYGGFTFCKQQKHIILIGGVPSGE